MNNIKKIWIVSGANEMLQSVTFLWTGGACPGERDPVARGSWGFGRFIKRIADRQSSGLYL